MLIADFFNDRLQRVAVAAKELGDRLATSSEGKTAITFSRSDSTTFILTNTRVRASRAPCNESEDLFHCVCLLGSAKATGFAINSV